MEFALIDSLSLSLFGLLFIYLDLTLVRCLSGIRSPLKNYGQQQKEPERVAAAAIQVPRKREGSIAYNPCN
jgi:hypothetical protein